MELPSLDEAEDTSSAVEQTGSSTGVSSRNVEKIPEEAAVFVYTYLKHKNGSFHLPVWSDDAVREISEAESEAFGIDEGTPVSVEGIFGMTPKSGRKFIGDVTYPKGHEERWSSEQFDSLHEQYTDDEIEEMGGEVEALEELDDFTPRSISDVHGDEAIDRHLTINIRKSLMGHYGEGLENFEDHEETYISCGSGSSKSFDDPEVRAKHTRIKLTKPTSDARAKALRAKGRSKWDCKNVDYSQSDYEEECSEAGIDPYPRRD